MTVVFPLKEDRHIPTRMFTMLSVTNINMEISGKIILFPASLSGK